MYSTHEVGFTFGAITNPQGQVIHNGTSRIGDRLIFSGIPEMMCNQRNYECVVDLDPNGFNWFWDFNPYVTRNAKAKQKIPLQMIADRSTHHTYLRNLPVFLSIPDKYCSYFGLRCTIRRPRLYKFEDIERKPNKVILVTQGNNQGLMMNESFDRILSDEIISTIVENYKNFEIVQIGTINDKKAYGKNIIDKRGIPNIWDVVKEISESMIVIGPSTGITWIAAAYPWISNKVILCEYNEVSLESYVPRITTNHHAQWSDDSFQLFNRYSFDVGVTSSYKNI